MASLVYTKNPPYPPPQNLVVGELESHPLDGHEKGHFNSSCSSSMS